jgi:uncharacterized protein (TIGR03086 family)
VHQVEVAWRDDEVLTHTMVLPWAELPGGAMLDRYLNELTVHTWDLATATGQAVAWDDDLLAHAWAAVEGMGADSQARFEEVAARMPAALRPSRPPFRDPAPVPADASPIERLVAWSGRSLR